ncbi:MAG: hypothetical protein WA906_05290, partial [Pacificimonas sp.]
FRSGDHGMIWWHRLEAAGFDGKPLLSIPPAALLSGSGTPDPANVLRLDGGRVVQTRYGSSRIEEGERTHIHSYALILGRDEIAGLSLGQIADLAAFTGLVRIGWPATSPEKSILSVVKGERSASELAPSDWRILEASYDVRLSLTPKMQRQRMIARVAK